MLGISYEKHATTSTNTADVFLRKWYSEGGNLASTLAERYDVAVMDLNDPVDAGSGDAGMGRWCGGCHGDFHGSTGGDMGDSGTGWLRHPAAVVDIGSINDGTNDTTHSDEGQYGGHTNRVKVMDPAGGTTNWDGSGMGLTPTCLSCHKAHGNQNPFGLIYMSGTGDIDEEGDDGSTDPEGRKLRDLCRQCHVQ